MTVNFIDSQSIPGLSGEVFLHKPRVLSGKQGKPAHSISPTEIELGRIIDLEIGLVDLGQTDDGYRLVRSFQQFSLGAYEFDSPQSALFPVLVETIDRDCNRLEGLILHKYHAMGKDGSPFGFQGYRVDASFADLGMEPFEDGMWAADVATLSHHNESSPPLHPLTIDQKRDLRKLLSGMKNFAGVIKPLALTRLEAELEYDEPPKVTVDQLRFLAHQPFLSNEQLQRLRASVH